MSKYDSCNMECFVDGTPIYTDIECNGKQITAHFDGKVCLLRGDVVDGKAIIPDEVTNIKECAFANNSDVIIAEIPDRVTRVGGRSFMMCDNLESVKMSDEVGELSSHTFNLCPNLKSIHLPANLIHIYTGAVRMCDSLEELVIPDKAFVMYESIIWSCHNLRRVVMSSQLFKCGNVWPFTDCPNLKEIICDGEQLTLDRFVEYLKYSGSGCSAATDHNTEYYANIARSYIS